MRIILGVLTIVLAAAPVGSAQYSQMMGRMPQPNTRSEPKDVLNGYLVDRACAERATSVAAAAPTHAVACLTAAKEPQLGVVANGKWVPFDEKGSRKAVELLKKASADKSARVTVTGRMKGAVFAVSSIEYLKM